MHQSRFLLLFITLFITGLNPLFSDEWDVFCEQTLSYMSTIDGHCSREKAILMMNLIKKDKLKNCVEIGVFAGSSLFPIAKALEYNKEGVVFAIDAWDPALAIFETRETRPEYKVLKELDWNKVYNDFHSLITRNGLTKHCKAIRQPSEMAAILFENKTIDFIHFDGNHGLNSSYQDVINYFPKVKNGGYILLNDANWSSLRRPLVFLLERCELLTEFNSSSSYLLFKKNEAREKKANALFIKDKT
jgi:hypothetical protein